MQGRSYRSSGRKLLDLASAQAGFFTAKQAAKLGYAAPKRTYHVKVGNWVRERRGIYRLAGYPLPDRPDLVLWWLWSRNRQDQPQGVFSHQTALSLHELTDLMPSRLHMTVPRHFRRSATRPKAVVLHFAEMPRKDVEQAEGVLVTNALRTLLDLAISRHVMIADLRAAFAAASKSGKITRAQISAAGKSVEWRDALRALRGRKT